MSEQKRKSLVLVIITSMLIVIGLIVLLVIEIKPIQQSYKIVDSFNEKFKSNKLEVIYYASSSCGYCTLETPILENISKENNMDYLHIDVARLTKNKRKEIAKKLSIKGATPSTVIVKNKKVIAKNEGYLEGTEYVEFLKKYGVLNENAVYKDEQYLSFINYNNYNDIINSKELSVIVIGQTGCSHCVATKPVLNKIAGKYNININYLNLNNLNEIQYKELITNLSNYGYDEEEYKKNGSIGTPLTLIIDDGKIIDYINGETTNSKFIKVFKKNKIIIE